MDGNIIVSTGPVVHLLSFLGCSFFTTDTTDCRRPVFCRGDWVGVSMGGLGRAWHSRFLDDGLFADDCDCFSFVYQSYVFCACSWNVCISDWYPGVRREVSSPRYAITGVSAERAANATGNVTDGMGLPRGGASRRACRIRQSSSSGCFGHDPHPSFLGCDVSLPPPRAP